MNINQLMKQAQAMQKKMQDMQSELENKEYEGETAAGAVKVAVNGKGEMLSISLDKNLIDPEEKDVLEDLIVAAFNDAKRKQSEDSESMMSGMGGLNLPPGFKMPF